MELDGATAEALLQYLLGASTIVEAAMTADAAGSASVVALNLDAGRVTDAAVSEEDRLGQSPTQVSLPHRQYGVLAYPHPH